MWNWTKAQWDAFGRHILTAAGSVLATLALLKVIDTAKAAEILTNFTTIVNSLIAFAAIIAPIYGAYRASQSASPTNQAQATVDNLNKGVELNGKKKELIAAVADQQDVQNVTMVTQAKAEEIPSDKVI